MTRHPVLTLTHNGLERTKRALISIYQQSVEARAYVIDNGSTDGTGEFLDGRNMLICKFDDNHGVSAGWNLGLTLLFAEFEHVLVIGNDVVLPPWFYELLLSYHQPFVTGIAVNSLEAIKEPSPREILQPAPDFSAFLIRRDAWEKIGQFDEGMKFYASDVDYHIRGAQLGIPMMKANVPYFHEGSATLRNAPAEERAQIERQANADRAYFYEKWGFSVGSPEHHRAVGFQQDKVLFPGVQTPSA